VTIASRAAVDSRDAVAALHAPARRVPVAVLGLVAALASCRANPSNATIREWAARTEQATPVPIAAEHIGPGVTRGDSGTARFARVLYETFQPERALETATFADRYYREPANEGYDAVLDRIVEELRAAGFGADEHLALEIVETRTEPRAWTPRRARLELRETSGAARVLHEFSKPDDRDRTMLPRNAPSARVEGEIALDVETLKSGAVLATSAALTRDLIERATNAGAAAVLSASLASYNTDPSGRDRHLDAIQYRSVAEGSALPVAQISPRSLALLQEAARKGAGARVAFEADVEIAARPLRMVVATIVGESHPEEAVVIAAHVQEPGACDNASGVATTVEGARDLAGLLASGALPRPSRSVVFVWGNELEQSRALIERTSREIVAAIAADMTGESERETGAIALLERPPDPGAIRALDPDEHTPWGSASVDASQLKPSALALVARSALIDVGELVAGWKTREHPFEGGSDHAVFIEHGIPAVLFWHFTDFAYHTSLDRLAHVDADEMHRTGAAILCTAMAIADAKPSDLDRYLRSLRDESDVRLAACDHAEDAALAESWREWFKGARFWLRRVCLGKPPANATPTNAAPTNAIQGNAARSAARP
jgi:Zn-dependent M28 family amino/carboxypeptidase